MWEKSLTSALEGCNLYLLVSRSWDGGGVWARWESQELVCCHTAAGVTSCSLSLGMFNTVERGDVSLLSPSSASSTASSNTSSSSS